MTKRKRERLLFVVTQQGTLAPADGITAGRCRERGYRVGDELLVEAVKPRHPGQWRCAHRLATLVQRNIEGFDLLPDAHDVLKKIQRESGIACEVVEAVTTDGEVVEVRIPRSLSYADMDQGEFEEVYKAMCRYVAATYWGGIPEEEVEAMAEMMPRNVA